MIIHPITRYFRHKRGKVILKYFPDIASLRICDLGGSQHFWEKLDIEGISFSNITIYNISSNEAGSCIDSSKQQIKTVIYDGCKIPASDVYFDLLVCNSVLEHVPPDKRQSLVKEMMRVAKHLFIQTPAYLFPIEPHFIMPFIHWLPRKIGYIFAHISLWRILSHPTQKEIDEYWWGTHLLTREELVNLFLQAIIQDEKFIGLTKSYYVVK